MNGLGFYNENEFRDYPFITRVETSADSASGLDIPQGAILDFGAIMPADEQFEDGTDYVYLESIRYDGVTLLFDFHTTAVGGGHCLFRRTLLDPEFAVTWADAIANLAVSSSSASVELPRWQAFLVTGRLEDLTELIAPGEALYFPPGYWKIEPGRVQNLSRSRVLRVHLANKQRLLWTPPEGCGESSSSAAADTVHVYAMDLAGDIKIEEGFQASVRQEDQNTAFSIGAGTRAGLGPPCDEVPRYPGEVAPAGSPFLTGGPACNELVKRINGVGGREFKLTGTNGVFIEPDPELPNTLLVTLDENLFDVE